MLNLVLITGDRIQIGDNVVIKLQSDSRAQLAIDAPREVNIKGLPPGRKRRSLRRKKFILQDPD